MQAKVNLDALTSDSSSQALDEIELTDSDLEQISGAAGMQHDFYPFPFSYPFPFYNYGYPRFFYPGFWGYGYGFIR
ncbi:hypothetical protein KDH_74940 [Dictyobacter sp. S3.2.2.5]|uniref:Bacteriocin n=1 Tax=Dictyobacter halimunensis TaxID=3026934 RepID=A0ABQ6G458_9CHLR|nr:hypothetical protein KDH_74940 [Dictyobacter sp. S3.2.2.5]